MQQEEASQAFHLMVATRREGRVANGEVHEEGLALPLQHRMHAMCINADRIVTQPQD